MKIALTGVSSFTGCHIAHALRAAGHEVLALLTRSADAYEDSLSVRRRMHAQLASEHTIYEAPFGSDKFLQALEDFRPEVFINHGADIKGYRNADFDVARSVEASLHNAPTVFAVLARVACARVVHTGSVFEPIDGLPALSPYGQSKFLVSESVERLTSDNGLAFSKIYIPNPIGPFENEDRMIPIFVRQWCQGQKPNLSTPKATWDHVPAPWLANIYVEECTRKDTQKYSRRPSAFAIELAAFVALFVKEAEHAGVTLSLDYTVADNNSAPVPRLNNEPCAEMSNGAAWNKFFADWMRSLFTDGMA